MKDEPDPLRHEVEATFLRELKSRFPNKDTTALLKVAIEYLSDRDGAKPEKMGRAFDEK